MRIILINKRNAAMHVARCLSVLLLVFGFTASAVADRIDHFHGKPADTLAEAIANFTEANRQLEKLLDGRLSDADMAAIHELTYTLEVALEKINEELDELAEVLEEVHLGSESGDRDAVKANGQIYLSVARELKGLAR